MSLVCFCFAYLLGEVQLGDILLQLHERNEVKLQQRLQETTVEVGRLLHVSSALNFNKGHSKKSLANFWFCSFVDVDVDVGVVVVGGGCDCWL